MINKGTMRIITPFIVVAILIVYINTKVLLIAYVPTESMEPVLDTGTYHICSRKIDELSREDIIVFQQEDVVMIKRIIGLPGEILEIRDNIIYINGKELLCPYIKDEMKTKDLVVRIPQNSYFVMGDNRNNSHDSRQFGTILKKQILAKL